MTPHVHPAVRRNEPAPVAGVAAAKEWLIIADGLRLIVRLEKQEIPHEKTVVQG
jgi:hypothetical protein